MSSKVLSFLAGFIAAWTLFLANDNVTAQDDSKNPSGVLKTPFGSSDLFRVGEMAQAASDLRKAGESFERLGNTIDGVAGKIAESLATMSSEFDPFGYKTAFRTVGQQMEVIRRQNEIIRDMQEQQIRRMRKENRSLKKRLRKQSKSS